MIYDNLQTSYMGIILKFKGKRLYWTSFLVYTIILLIVLQYVTYITTFKTVDTFPNSSYYTSYGIVYHFKKASKHDYTITLYRPTYGTVRKSHRIVLESVIIIAQQLFSLHGKTDCFVIDIQIPICLKTKYQFVLSSY